VFAPAALSSMALQINGWLREVTGAADIVQRYRDASIEPLALDMPATAALVRQRLELVDAMRLAVFGRTR
jgi:hypothetical protein